MSLDLDLLERWDEVPFEYGTADCASFALDAARHYGNVDVTLPEIASERDYLKLLSRSGSLAALVSERLDAPVAVSEALVGDIVLTAFPEQGEVLGVADPPLFWVRGKDGGFIPLSLDLAVGVWPCRR